METLKHFLATGLIVLLLGTNGIAQEQAKTNTSKNIEVYAEDSTLVLTSPTAEVVSVDLNANNTLPYVVHAGDIGIIVFDGQDTRESSLGQLYTLRRQLKAKVWTITVSVTPCESLPIRTQLTLFEDDPVDVLLSPKALPEAYALWDETKCIGYPEKGNPLQFKSKSFILPKVNEKK